MKKTFILFMIAILVTTLISCGESGSGSGEKLEPFELSSETYAKVTEEENEE